MAVLGFLYNKYILIVSRDLYWVGYLIETHKYDTKIKGLEKLYFFDAIVQRWRMVIEKDC